MNASLNTTNISTTSSDLINMNASVNTTDTLTPIPGYEWPIWHAYFMNMTYAIVAVGIIVNLVVLWTVVRVRRLHTPMYLSAASLAVTDALSLVACAVTCIIFGGGVHVVSFICILNEYMANALTFISSLHIVLISFERYIAVLLPLKARTILTNKSMLKVIAGIYIGGLAFVAPYATMIGYSESYGCYMKQTTLWQEDYMVVTAILKMTVPMILILFFNIRITITMIKGAKQRRILTNNLRVQSDQKLTAVINIGKKQTILDKIGFKNNGFKNIIPTSPSVNIQEIRISTISDRNLVEDAPSKHVHRNLTLSNPYHSPSKQEAHSEQSQPTDTLETQHSNEHTHAMLSHQPPNRQTNQHTYTQSNNQLNQPPNRHTSQHTYTQSNNQPNQQLNQQTRQDTHTQPNQVSMERTQANKNANTSPNTSHNTSSNTTPNTTSLKTPVIMMGLVVLFFVLLIWPFQLCLLLNERGILTDIPEDMILLISWIGRICIFINASINPFIYTAVSPNFRSAVVKAFSLPSRTTGSNQAETDTSNV